MKSVMMLLAILLIAGCSPRLNNKYYNQYVGLQENPTIEQVIDTRPNFGE